MPKTLVDGAILTSHAQEAREIAARHPVNVGGSADEGGKPFAVDDDALELIVGEGDSPACGARCLSAIDHSVKLPISAHWDEGQHFHVRVEVGEVAVKARESLLAAHTLEQCPELPPGARVSVA